MLKWHTEKRKVADLRGWEDNPRTITSEAYAELKGSIEKLGNFEPLVVDVDGTVIAGNQRLKIHIEKGDEEIEVSVPSRKLTAREIKKIGVISNRHSGEWDMSVLQEEFQEVLDELSFDDLIPKKTAQVEEDNYEEPEGLEGRAKVRQIWYSQTHRTMLIIRVSQGVRGEAL